MKAYYQYVKVIFLRATQETSGYPPPQSRASRDEKCRLIGGLVLKAVQIGIPFNGEEVFFLAVAFLACGNYIAFPAFSSAAQGNHVVHGELLTAHVLLAIEADSLVYSPEPPLAPSQLPGLFLLPLYLLDIHFNCIKNHY